MSINRLWASWRSEYINREEDTKECIFCNKPKEDIDKENLILYRGIHCFTIMNKYPYNTGHLMVVPYKHISDICLLDNNESMELIKQVQYFINIIKNIMKPNGFNVGFNIGKAGGAGIADHIHMHIVPRWSGDTNFMPIIGETKVLSENIFITYDKLIKAIKKEK